MEVVLHDSYSMQREQLVGLSTRCIKVHRPDSRDSWAGSGILNTIETLHAKE
jgi:hypothetical protein